MMRSVVRGTCKPPHAEERAERARVSKHASEEGAAPLDGCDVCTDHATLASFCRQRTIFGIGVSGKLVFQLVTPTSPT